MELIFILLGTLIILSLFNVGEIFYKKIGLKNYFVTIFLILLLLSLFLPNIIFDNIGITISGVIIPFLLCFKFLKELNSKRAYLSFFVSVLVIITSVMLINILDEKGLNNINFTFIFIYGICLAILAFSINISNSFILFSTMA